MKKQLFATSFMLAAVLGAGSACTNSINALSLASAARNDARDGSGGSSLGGSGEDGIGGRGGTAGDSGQDASSGTGGALADAGPEASTDTGGVIDATINTVDTDLETGGIGSGGIAGSGGTTSTGGTTATGGSSLCPSNPDMISDFESTPGKADMNPQGHRTGYWYVVFSGSDGSTTPAAGMSQTPAPGYGSPIATEAAPDASTCNQFALHSTGSGFNTPDNNQFGGFGAFFLPHVPYDGMGDGYDLNINNYTGISFKMKSGGGTPPAVFFEVLTKESLPKSAGGTATDPATDLYNTRGQLLNAPWAPSDISTTYQTFTVPFGTLVPRWLPAPYGWPYTYSCTDSGLSVPRCQAKPFVPQDVLGIRVSMYVPMVSTGFPEPAGSTIGTYDLWIDDVMFVKDDNGLQARAGFPLASPGKFGSCIMPRGPSADAKFLVSAYNQWKARFVKDNKVIRPENQNDTLSEGVAFGMMIAVNMNDQTLFDGLYGTWRSNPVTGASTLMKSCLRSSVGSNGASCSLTDSSATGADEDAAYALLMAGKLWGGTYQADGVAMLKDIWDKDIDGAGTLLPKGGSNYQSPTGTDPWQITSASYFAPSFYRAFASVDTNVSHDWAGVISAVYKVINGPISGSNGLIPAWCGNSCTIAASNGGSNDFDYQYDSHRIPMRIGLDYCFNGTAEAKIYADLTTKFFAGLGKAGLGIGQIADMYAPTGSRVGSTSANSASVLGTAAVGAMATGEQTFLNDAYQTVFDLATRGTMAPRLYQDPTPSPNPQPTYSYYNATVGMLTLLILTGNFMH